MPYQTVIRIDPDAIMLEPLDLDQTDFQSPLPKQHFHLIFEDAAIGMAVGIWDTTTMQEAFGPYPGDEFITVLEGRFAILDGAGIAVIGEAGQSAVFRNAIPVSWKQEGYLRKIYLTLQTPEADVPKIGSASGGVLVLDADRAAPVATGVDGVAREVLFRNDAGNMTVTHITHPALDLPPVQTGAHELCRVLAGEITLTDPAGDAHCFGPGSHFFVPNGVACARSIRAGTSALHVLVTT